MIDKNKQYKTRDGREVRIYATDGAAPWKVHGAVKIIDGNWKQEVWLASGQWNINRETEFDLIEVVPPIERWALVRKTDGHFYTSYESEGIANEVFNSLNHQNDYRIVHLREVRE
jgi:hypothetical protein